MFNIFSFFIFLLFFSLPTTRVQAQECPPAINSQTGNLRLFSLCENEKTDCKKLAYFSQPPYQGNSEEWVPEKELVWLKVDQVKAIRTEQGYRISLVLEEISKCWFHKITQEHRKKRLAIVHQKKILTAPTVQEAISGGKMEIFFPMGTSAMEVKQICQSIRSDCEINDERSFFKRLFKK